MMSVLPTFEWCNRWSSLADERAQLIFDEFLMERLTLLNSQRLGFVFVLAKISGNFEKKIVYDENR